MLKIIKSGFWILLATIEIDFKSFSKQLSGLYFDQKYKFVVS